VIAPVSMSSVSSPRAAALALELDETLGPEWPAFASWLALFDGPHAADVVELLERSPEIVVEQFRRGRAEHPPRPWSVAR